MLTHRRCQSWMPRRIPVDCHAPTCATTSCCRMGPSPSTESAVASACPCRGALPLRRRWRSTRSSRLTCAITGATPPCYRIRTSRNGSGAASASSRSGHGASRTRSTPASSTASGQPSTRRPSAGPCRPAGSQAENTVIWRPRGQAVAERERRLDEQNQGLTDNWKQLQAARETLTTRNQKLEARDRPAHPDRAESAAHRHVAAARIHPPDPN